MSLELRLNEVKSRIANAAQSVGREPHSVELIVVSKNHPAQMVLDLLQLGQRQFGENKDQEAAAKAAEVTLAEPSLQPIWHFVGQLQSNKVKSMLNYASVLHSLDRISLLKELAKQLENRPDKQLEVFIELNLTNDPDRGGIAPADLLGFAELVLNQPQLKLLGVMGVAGLDVDPSLEFDRISQASQTLARLAPNARFISAGMSADFEIAIAHGATHIRVGTAITGKR